MLPSLHMALPATELHRTRLEAAACSIPLLRETEAPNTHRDPPMLPIPHMAHHPPLRAGALTRATGPTSRT